MSSDDSSVWSAISSSSDQSFDEIHGNILQEGVILGYQFEPRRETSSSESESAADEMLIDEEQPTVRLDNLDWCICEHCQMMDREEECLCCHEVEQTVNKNDEVFERVQPAERYQCITDNPGFRTVCLDIWVLQAAWLQYKQQYGNTAYEGPEHKMYRHTAYRQLVPTQFFLCLVQTTLYRFSPLLIPCVTSAWLLSTLALWSKIAS